MGCVLGKLDCPELSGGVIDSAVDEALTGSYQLPWSGLALGTNDLVAAAGTGRARLVAVVGAASAGKTSALAAHWLAARRGEGQLGPRFVGSTTLAGWHAISRHLQWRPHGNGFPPHTVAADNRQPSLLHMSVAADTHRKQLYYTDVPGEWFRDWATDQHSVPGATWIAEHASAFVIFADSEALAGPQRGEARADYEALASRLATTCGNRPVVAVRSKADIEVRPSIRQRIEQINADRFSVATVAVSIDAGDGFSPLTDAIDLAADAALAPTMPSTTTEAVPDHPLYRYRSSVLPS